jgi:hypothetical protein
MAKAHARLYLGAVLLLDEEQKRLRARAPTRSPASIANR